MDTNFTYSRYQSGENYVELKPKGEGYEVISNGAVVFSSDKLPDALAKYYREISGISNAQQNNHDLALKLFGDEVVKLNRVIIPKLAALGKHREVKYIKALNKAISPILNEAMKEFFKDSEYQKFNEYDILNKYEPVGDVNPASIPAAGGDELQNAGAGETVTPRRLELKRGKKIDNNTVELKSINGIEPFPEEDKLNIPVEKPTKINSTYQMKNHPKEQKNIDGTEIEPVYIKRSRVDKDQAFKLGRDLGVDFDTIDLNEWMEGLDVEHEHYDIVGDDHRAIGKIAHAHLKEDPHYYYKLKKYVEKSLRKDFSKMEEGDQAHENVGFENKNTIGRSQQPINGDDDEKMEKASFSMDAPVQENMKTPSPIVHKAEGWHKEDNDYQGETSNNSSYAKEVRLKRHSSLDKKGAGGDDVRDGHDALFQYSLNREQIAKIAKMISEDIYGQ